MITRRRFLSKAALGAAGLGAAVIRTKDVSGANGRFGLHPFIENHPEAVFIMRTDLHDKMDDEAKNAFGRDFGRIAFVSLQSGGVPSGISIPVKPNFKTAPYFKHPQDMLQGTATDPWFIEGMIGSMQELGISGKQFHLREVNRPETFGRYGFVDMAKRSGADLRLDLATPVGKGLEEGRDYNWTDIPDGVVFDKIPHLEPINTPGTFMLNIAKMKTHPMGMTLCCKNLQGAIAHNFQQLCNPSMFGGKTAAHQRKNAAKSINSNYRRHVREEIIPRWDRPGRGGGKWQELWASRTLDNVSATPCALHVIEGMYSRDGNASICGPHPIGQKHKYNWLGFSSTGKSRDHLSNVIVFGKDIFRVDLIGYWLGGHEPGNFGLYHLAIERGLSNALDPQAIPVYLWDENGATLLPLESFDRTALLTMYLRRDYDGLDEQFYHLVNEPFDYSKVDGIAQPPVYNKPVVRVAEEIVITPFRPWMQFEYHLPKSGDIKLEIAGADGNTVAVPAEGKSAGGAHLARWDTTLHPAGIYQWRFRANGETITGDIRLEK